MLFETEMVTYRGVYKTISTEKLNIPTKDGRRTILSNHMPIMIPIELGVIETLENNIICNYAVSEGMLYFNDNHATLVCDVIEDIRKIDLKIYEKRIEEAKDRLKTARTDSDIRKAKIDIARATNIVKAAGKNYH